MPQARSIKLPDDDLDSGKPTAAGEYTLADDTYAKLLSQLADKKFDVTTVALQKNILDFLLRYLGADRHQERSRQVAEGAEQSRSAEDLHAESGAIAAHRGASRPHGLRRAD